MTANPLVGKNNQQTVFVFFGLSDDEHGIVSEKDRLQGRVYGSFVPLADDGLGNVFVMSAETGGVLFWHHECPAGEHHPDALTAVAPTVSMFLEGLMLGPKLDRNGLKSGLKRIRLDF